MKKGFSIILALALSLTGVYSVKSDELTDAQKELNNVRKSINDKKGELENIDKEKRSVEDNLNDLIEKMRSTSETLTQLNGKIEDLDFQVAELEVTYDILKKCTKCQINVYTEIYTTDIFSSS